MSFAGDIHVRHGNAARKRFLKLGAVYVLDADPRPHCASYGVEYSSWGPVCGPDGPEPLSRVNYWSDSPADDVSDGNLVPEPNSALFLAGRVSLLL